MDTKTINTNEPPLAETTKPGLLDRIPSDTNMDLEDMLNKVADFLKPEALTSFWNEHKSGVVIAAVWLILHIRSWLSLLPFPALLRLTTLVYLVAITTFPILPIPRIFLGLPRFAYAEISSSITSLRNKILPSWVLFRVVPLVLLFSPTQAMKLLVGLAAWEIANKFRLEVDEIVGDVEKAISQGAETLRKAEEQLEEVRRLEGCAIQLASSNRRNDNEVSQAIITIAKEVRGEVDIVGREVEFLKGDVERAREMGEKAKRAALEGRPGMAMEMVGKLTEMIDLAEGAERQLWDKVYELKGRFWEVCLG